MFGLGGGETGRTKPGVLYDVQTCVMTLHSISVCLDVQVFQGLLERDKALVINVTGQQGDTVDILVENMGRVNFGSKINDYKVRKTHDCEERPLERPFSSVSSH